MKKILTPSQHYTEYLHKLCRYSKMCLTPLLIGGTDESWTAFSTAERYDIDTDMWFTLPDLNCPRIDPGICEAQNGKIFVFGGRNSKKVELKSVECFDPETATWTLLPEGMKVKNSSHLSM